MEIEACALYFEKIIISNEKFTIRAEYTPDQIWYFVEFHDDKRKFDYPSWDKMKECVYVRTGHVLVIED